LPTVAVDLGGIPAGRPEPKAAEVGGTPRLGVAAVRGVVPLEEGLREVEEAAAAVEGAVRGAGSCRQARICGGRRRSMWSMRSGAASNSAAAAAGIGSCTVDPADE
jgi:hypothetical protein